MSTVKNRKGLGFKKKMFGRGVKDTVVSSNEFILITALKKGLKSLELNHLSAVF